MQTKRAIIIFADIQGSTGFGFTQPLEKYNEMLRDFHKTCHDANDILPDDKRRGIMAPGWALPRRKRRGIRPQKRLKSFLRSVG